MMRWILACSLFVIPISHLIAADSPALGSKAAAGSKADTGVTVLSNIPFATIDKTELQLDLAMPKGKGPFPCVVCLHGGAWILGHRKELAYPGGLYDFGTPDKSLIQLLAEQGYVAATVSYRLAPRCKFPAQIQDVKTSIRFLRKNAEKYHIDSARFAVLGLSAGGHLAALVGCTNDEDLFDGKLYPKQSSRVSCVVDFYGPADLTLYCETPAIEKAVFEPLLGYSSKEKKEAYTNASPISHADKGDPPILIFHGTADLIVPVIHSEHFCAKLKQCGVNAELVTLSGEGHGWNGKSAKETTGKMLAFLKKQLKGKE